MRNIRTGSWERLINSLKPSCKMCHARFIGLGFLFGEQRRRGREIDKRNSQEREYVGPESRKAERFGESPDADRLEIGAGKNLCCDRCRTGERGDGHKHAGKLYRRKNCNDGGGKDRCRLRRGQYGNQKAKSGACENVD